jgi:hypothetical protein
MMRNVPLVNHCQYVVRVVGIYAMIVMGYRADFFSSQVIVGEAQVAAEPMNHAS